ncbi:MAG: hypothetical protein NT170_01250 [Candidatus Moranbacteria bacterium]|nr:hypothetical protein [Candidatus Moranbacteria bacterium]
MHKTLYIDIDEEITSIIDRMRKAEAKEVIIVAPKNAMLLQSIVNLKLLKKEADRRKKQLLIITQDKIGKKLIEKAGILAQAKPGKDLYLDAEPDEKSYDPMYATEASQIKEELEKEEQKKEIGSSNFFDQPLPKEPEMAVDEPVLTPAPRQARGRKAPQATAKRPAMNEKMPSISQNSETIDKKEEKSRVSMSDIVMNDVQPKKKKAKPEIIEIEQEPEPQPKADQPRAGEDKQDKKILFSNSFTQAYSAANAIPSTVSRVSIKKADKFFRGSRKMKKDFEIARVGGGAKKFFIFFAGIFVLLAALAAAYFFFPKATLALQIKNQEKSVSLDLTAAAQNNGTSISDKTLPANLEQITKDATEDFDATGSKDGGAKATGQAVIYNEFSGENQPLVATTRLETGDGKIFRITKGVVVPGMTNVGGETKPGAIQVDIAADQPGDSYNIDPTSFKIPGFKDTPAKYEKFSAKSSSPTTGGSAGAAKVVTAQDIASAKEKIAVDAKKSALAELKGGLSPDRKIFDDAVQVEVQNISMSDNAGAEKEKFSATAKLQVSALSFQEADVKKLMKDNLAQSGANGSEISFDKPITYVLADSNIGQKTLNFQAKTDAKIGAGLDVENFKKGILGKTEADAQIYAKNFPAIQQMDITFWPFFVNRIPMREGRVVVEVK